MKKQEKTKTSFVSTIYKYLILILPLALFFSYYPVISLGANSSMNFELSIPLIWLVAFDAVGIVYAFERRVLFNGFLRKWAWLLFPVWGTLTVIWSVNMIRGVLTIGILWLICLAGYIMWQLRDVFDETFRIKFWKWFFYSKFKKNETIIFVLSNSLNIVERIELVSLFRVDKDRE